MTDVRFKKLMGSFVLLAVLGVVSCAGNSVKSFSEQGLELGYVKRIVVLPFENNTQAKFAEERLRDVVSTEILSRGLFEVVEKGELDRFLQREIFSQKGKSVDLQAARRMADELKVEAFLAGSVDDFSEDRNGSYSFPVVAATLRLVDAKTGKILWQAFGSLSGYSTGKRIFGLASEDVNQVSFKLVRMLLNTI